jgi:FkbM family methyltransferase
MSKRYGRVLAALVNGLTLPQHRWRRAHTRLRVANALFQNHEVATRHGTVVFVSTQPQTLLFPQYHAIREPETIEWIDAFETPCIFWDVGANVGEFVLQAAVRPGISVLAFEPSAASYAALCRNIEVNRRSGQVQAFCVALNNQTQLGRLNMSATNAGNSFNSFESTEDCFGRELEIAFRQSTIGFSIDGFRRLFELPPPNHVKIDVDGTEEQILDGALETLADPALRSVLIELEEADTARKARIVERLERAGFVLSSQGAGQGGVVNGIFTRPAG